MGRSDIGIIAPILKGNYNAAAAYNRLNIVHGSDGATYQAITEVPAGTALSNTTYWMQITPKAPSITSEDVAYDYAQSHTDLVTNTGTTMTPVLHFKVPRGVTGNDSIDDTAGEGDDDVVWSADKSYSEISGVKHNIECNAYDMLYGKPFFVKTYVANGITFTWDDAYSECTVSGTATDNATFILAETNSADSYIAGVLPGHKYYLYFDPNNQDITIAAYYVMSDNQVSLQHVFTHSGSLVLPNDQNLLGVQLRIRILQGKVVNTTIKRPVLSTARKPEEISDEILNDKILECAKSYYATMGPKINKDSVYYSYGSHSATRYNYVGKTDQIHCGCMTELVTGGCSFYQSRYNDSNNKNHFFTSGYGFDFYRYSLALAHNENVDEINFLTDNNIDLDIDLEDYKKTMVFTDSAKQARALLRWNMLFDVLDNDNNIDERKLQVGDLLFFEKASDHPIESLVDGHYITHVCNIVKEENGLFYCIEAGLTPVIIKAVNTYMGIFSYCKAGRVPFHFDSDLW